MDEQECAFKVLRNKNALLRVEKITLQDKFTELETELAEVKKI